MSDNIDKNNSGIDSKKRKQYLAIAEHYLAENPNDSFRRMNSLKVAQWAKKRYDIDAKELANFLFNERERIKQKDKEYESKRVKKTVTFKLEEWQKVNDIINSMDIDFNKYARACILSKRIKLDNSKKIKKELLYELNRIGNNLNQIAKYANFKKELDTKILNQLQNITKELERLSS